MIKRNRLQKILNVTISILFMMLLGLVYSWGIFLKYLTKYFNASRSEIALTSSILLLTFSISMTLGGYLYNKLGPKITGYIGGILLSTAWFLGYLSKTPFHLHLSIGLLGGIATGILYNTALTTALHSYPEKKGLITGLVTFGFGFGSAVLAPLLNTSIEHFGWQLTMLYLAILIFSVKILGSTFLSTIKNYNKTNLIDDNSLTPLETLKTYNFYILFIIYIFSMIGGTFIITHSVSLITDYGYSTIKGALAITLLSITNGLGRIFFGYLKDKLKSSHILIILNVIMLLSFIMLLLTKNLFLIYLCVTLVGFAFGGFLGSYPSITIDFFGFKYFNINYALIFIGYGIGCFFGPIISGRIYDFWGSYNYAIIFSLILYIMNLILTLNLKKDNTEFST